VAASRRGYKRQRAWVLLLRYKNLSGRASCHGISTRSVDDQVKAMAIIDERCKPPDSSLPTRRPLPVFSETERAVLSDETRVLKMKRTRCRWVLGAQIICAHDWVTGHRHCVESRLIAGLTSIAMAAR
jgi:hypothetical protein